jgi:flagellar M-ring protein FliF
VAKLIPLPATGTAADLISVASYDRLETAEAPPEPSLMVQASEILTHWGGPAALAIFALWALWMLNRSLKSLPQEPAPALSGASAGAGSAASAALAVAAAPAPEPENKEPTRRDKLQTLVRDNPEMAASVLTRWLATTK